MTTPWDVIAAIEFPPERTKICGSTPIRKWKTNYYGCGRRRKCTLSSSGPAQGHWLCRKCHLLWPTDFDMYLASRFSP